MNLWEALLLGLLQGLTEFLPISSSGHLALASVWLAEGQSGAENLFFSMILHLATAFSILFVYRARIAQLIRHICTTSWQSEHTFASYLLLSALPAGVLGLLFKDNLTHLFAGHVKIVGLGLLCTAGLLWLSQKRAQACDKPLTILRVLCIGLSQACALLPGISRSGATLSTALYLGISRKKAAEFSFLMALIPILGGAGWEIVSLFKEKEVLIPHWPIWLSGASIAFVSGCIACKWMIQWVVQGKLLYFALYCLCIGTIALFFG